MRTDRKIDVPFRTQQFVILAVQVGSFHKAAHALGVDHSRIVRSIDRLERDLGVRIFERTRHRFSITKAGVPFVREILEAVAHVERACDLARYSAQIFQGPFRVGYSTFVHSRLVPLLQGLKLPLNPTSVEPQNNQTKQVSDEPIAESEVMLECGNTIELIDRVMRGGLHAAFGVTPLLERSLSIYPITREPFTIAVSKNHRLAKQASILARDLDREAVFLFPRSAHPPLFDRTIDYIESTGASPIPRETISFTHTMEIVAHNFGIALLPRSASRFSHAGVLFKPITDQLLFIETALFHALDQEENRIQWFLHELLLQIRQASLDR